MHLVLHAQRKIRKISNQMGYDIVRKPLAESSLYLYDGFESACLAEKRFYNVGAGDFYHPYWTNIDYPTEHYAESQKHDFIHFNLMLEQPLPIDNNVAEIVYSSHTIEHISDGAAINMINEAYRILKPGGCLRITTPDAARSFDAYLRGDIEYWYYRRRYATNGTWEKYFKKPLDQATIQQLLVDHVATQVSGISLDPTPHEEFDDQQIKDIFSTLAMEEAYDFFTKRCTFNPEFPGSHMNWWTPEKLFAIMKRSGFSRYVNSGYGLSRCPPLRDLDRFDRTHPRISLYVEAFK